MFNSLFGSSEKKTVSIPKMDWIPLKNVEQINEIMSLSFEKPVLIFKHSTRCIVSRTALKQFENKYDVETLQGNVSTYFLDLLEYREVSNEIANRFNVVHQSPQLLLIKEGKSVYDVSHDGIDAEAIKSML